MVRSRQSVTSQKLKFVNLWDSPLLLLTCPTTRGNYYMRILYNTEFMQKIKTYMYEAKKRRTNCV